MPDVATGRLRDVTITGGGGFGLDSAAVFYPQWSTGGGDPLHWSRKFWLPTTTVTYWGVPVTASLAVSSGHVSGAASIPSITLTLSRGGTNKSVTVAGTSYTGSTYIEPILSAQQYFDTSSGSFSFTEGVHCVQHLRPDAYEVRSAISFTCSASIDVHFVDTLGSGTQTISASLTMTDADIPGYGGSTYVNYDYAFGFGDGVPVHFAVTGTIGFDSPGLISARPGLHTSSGSASLDGPGNAITWSWSGGEAAINPHWAAHVPTAQVSFFPSWALTLETDMYHYADGSEVGATLQDVMSGVVAEFTSGTSYRYPASGLMHYANLDSFDSGALSDGSGFQGGVPADYPITGGDYSPRALQFSVPGVDGVQTRRILAVPEWANDYGTFTRGPLHPAPGPLGGPAGSLNTKVWNPYQQGTLTFDAVHRFSPFDGTASDSLAVYTTADATGDSGAGTTTLPIADATGFAVGNNVQVGSLGDGNITALDTGSTPNTITLDTSPVFGLVPRGTAVILNPSRWVAGNATAGSTFPAGWDTAPVIDQVSGAGIDGTAIRIQCTGPTQMETAQRWLLLHQGYRYGRLRVLIDGLSTTLAADVSAGDTTLPVAWEMGFVVGDKVTVGSGAAQEMATVSAVTPAALTVSALAHAHSTGDPVTRSDAGSVMFSLANQNTVAWTVDRPRTQLVLDAPAGSTSLLVGSTAGFVVGCTVDIGSGAGKETVTVSAIAANELSVSATALDHAAPEPVVLSLGQWFTAELDLAAPTSEWNGTSWTGATRLYQPFEFAPDPQPTGASHGASLAILPSGTGLYLFDYLEGYLKDDSDGSTRTPLLIWPFLDGYGDNRNMLAYENTDQEPASDPTDPVQALTWAVNGVRGATVCVHSEHTSQTLWWQYLAAQFDSDTLRSYPVTGPGASLPNDTGITVEVGTAGTPDPLMVFNTGNMGEYPFLGQAPATYGFAPAPGDTSGFLGHLRSEMKAYYGAGDLLANSGGYDPVVGFHGDWVFDGEAFLNLGAARAAVTLNDNDTGDVIASATTDDDGAARLPARYGVYYPYDNVDGSAEWADPPDLFTAHLVGSYDPGSTDLAVTDESGFEVGEAIIILPGGSGEVEEVTTITALSAGQITVPATASFHGNTSPVQKHLSEAPLELYTPLGMNLNADWIAGDVSPVDSEGYWAEPVVYGLQNVIQRESIVILDRYQTWLRPAAGVAQEVYNLTDEYGKYWRADVLSGAVRVQYSQGVIPPFATAAILPGGGQDARPKIAFNHRRELNVIFTRNSTRAGEIFTATSFTEGREWSIPEALPAAGAGSSHPAIAGEPDTGLLARAWREADGTGRAVLTMPGEALADVTPVTFADAAGALALDDDSFSLIPGASLDGRWWLLGVFGGQPKIYFSTDELATWQHFADILAGGRHPQLAIDKGMGTLVAGAWFVDGQLRISAMAPGETVFSDPQTVASSGGVVTFAEGGFGLSQATEMSGRWVLVAVVAGEASPSEWWATDDATWTFKRVT
jgi:hypothetical protein